MSDLNFSDEVFADDSNSPFEGNTYNYLQDPYLGPATMSLIHVTEINDKQCLEVIFTATDEEHNGETHGHVIWEPEPGHPSFDEAKFKSNTTKFLGHLLYRFSTEATEEDRQLWARKQLVAKGWLPFCRQVVAAFESVNYQDKTDLIIKIPGSAYKQNKPRLRIPPWPFTSDDRSSGTMRWSKKDLQQNAEYLAKRDQLPTPQISSDTFDDSALLALEGLDGFDDIM